MKINMTPERRITLAFWLGTLQAACCYLLIETYQAVGRPDFAWVVWLIPWLVILFFFARNNLNFSRETVWMTIKNPNKVGGRGWVNLDDMAPPNNSTAPTSPPGGGRPPPPPVPPKKRSLGGGR